MASGKQMLENRRHFARPTAQSRRAEGVTMSQLDVRIADISKKLSRLLADLPDNGPVVDTLDYIAGAVYSLSRCDAYPFWDRRGPRLSCYRDKLITYIAGMAGGMEPGEYWLSGYYLNSALQRIAGAYDRVPKLILGIPGKDRRSADSSMETVFGDKSKYQNWKDVHSEMNPLKHWAIGLSEKRRVGKTEATAALEEILALLESKQSQLHSMYDAPRGSA